MRIYRYSIALVVSLVCFQACSPKNITPTSSRDSEVSERSFRTSNYPKMNKVASRVLNDLKEAKGILPQERPFLIVKRFIGSPKIAMIDLDKGEIHLDQLTYTICRGMGRDSLDALAFILGHELGHFIHGHGQINHNITDALQQKDTVPLVSGTKMGTLAGSKSESDIDKDTYNEAEADFEGGFLGYLAGYEPMKAGRELLRRVYRHPFMGLNEVMPGYPTLQERLSIIENTARRIAALRPLFEAANYLAAIGQFEDAIPFLEKILVHFKSREIYNNIGVLYLLETLRLREEPITPYEWPLQLDASFRAPHPQFYNSWSGIIGGIPSDITKHEYCRESLLQKQVGIAASYFEKAIDLDNDYLKAHLNLAIAQALKGIFYAGGECYDQRMGLLNSALGQVIKSQELAIASMTGITADFFALPASDSIVYVPITEFKRLPDLGSGKSWMITPSGDSIQIEVDSIYPYKKELFGLEYWSMERNWETKQTRGVIWNTLDGAIPNQAVMLSNIHVVKDLIRIYKNELIDGYLSSPLMYQLKTVKRRPFYRSLELFPDNQIAQLNQMVALGALQRENQSSDAEICRKREMIFNIPLKKFIKDSVRFEKEILVSKSKLISYYESGLVIEESDRNKLKNSYVPLYQSLKYKINQNYKVFVNDSKLEKDKRVERTSFLQYNFGTGNLTSCGIQKGTTLKELTDIYGKAARVTYVHNGSYHVFPMFLEASETIDTIPQPFRRRDATFVSETSELEEGIIFKITPHNTIIDWVLYERFITTGLPDIFEQP